MNEKDWDILEYAVKYHDLGKINTKFQNKLYKVLKYPEKLEDNDEGEEIPHGYLSTSFINTKLLKEEFEEDDIKVLVNSVYYHHDRKIVDVTEEAIKDLRIQTKGLKEFLNLNLDIIKKCSEKYILSPDTIENVKLLTSKKYILVKGLLNKLDYVASMDKQNVKVEEDAFCDGKSVEMKIKDITKEKYKNKFRPVQEYMMKNKENNLVVISYTGSGKTEAALLWVGQSKAMYTLPLKVSINSIYKRIKEQIKYEKVLLLHSDAYSYYDENYDRELNMYDRARRMSSPLIITTVDQLFKIAFRYKGYEEILATLSYSKIILDEIQMYSPEMLAYIMVGLSMITKMGGKFAVITATFPPVLYDIMNDLGIVYKKQEEEFKVHISNRHKISIYEKKDFEIEKIIKDAKKKRVLVIVNTVKKAQELYEKLEEENVHLLHSKYLKKDRGLLEEEIFEFGNKEDEKGIWISTQIVEASLDIDFDILYTDMCSIDSLFQRMGRVYRKREYKEEEPNVHIYDNRNGVPYIIDSEIYDYTLEEIKQYNNKNLSEKEKQDMINNIFSLEKNKKLKESNYYKKINKEIRLVSDIIPNGVEKSEVDEKFRNIQNIKLIPDNIFSKLDNDKTIDRWEIVLNSSKSSFREKMEAKNEIENYVVSVRWSPMLEVDESEMFYKGSDIYRTRYEYEFDEKILKGKGLIMKKMENIGYFDE